jgi:hypothetical protein
VSALKQPSIEPDTFDRRQPVRREAPLKALLFSKVIADGSAHCVATRSFLQAFTFAGAPGTWELARGIARILGYRPSRAHLSRTSVGGRARSWCNSGTVSPPLASAPTALRHGRRKPRLRRLQVTMGFSRMPGILSIGIMASGIALEGIPI